MRGSTSGEDRYVYRRVPDGLWRKGRTGPKPEAFVPRPGQTMSVFDATMTTARQVLQHQIDTWRNLLGSPDADQRARAEKWLARTNGTVEGLVRCGWGVVRLPVSALMTRGFVLSAPEPNGHQNVTGDYELYDQELSELAEVAEVEADSVRG